VILLIANTCEIVVKGIIAPSVPTLCFWLTKTCLSCNEWYNLNIYSVSQGVIYILCTIALLFVVAFERVFSDYLHQIEPYWKFWGVKCVVTVTYFQWLVFKYCFGLHDQSIYLWHSLMCTLEMPLLCIMHATYAYPYGKGWVDHLIDEMPIKASDPGASESPHLRKRSGISEVSRDCPETLWEYLSGGLQLCFYGVVTVCCCALSVKSIMWIVPPQYDLTGEQWSYNITCSEGDLLSYIRDHAKSTHWVVPQGMRPSIVGAGEGSVPERASFWLPLCGNIPVGCQLGYRGHHVVRCTATGRYEMKGQCSVVGCGTPPKVPHAGLVLNTSQVSWTAGMRAVYACDKGYRGAPFASCSLNGSWVIHQRCELVGCGTLEGFLLKTRGACWRDTMTSPKHADLVQSYAGYVVHFQCRPGYRGQPMATCQEGGAWALTDPCEPFSTSLGCRCLPAWEHCGGWLGTSCKEWYGCASAFEPFDWCQVDPTSCPRKANDMWGVSPSWDFCVSDNFNQTWTPKPVPDRGIVPSLQQVYSALVFTAAAVLSFYCARLLTKGAILACCYASVLLHKVVAPAASRCPGAARRRWRIVAFQFHFAWRRLLAVLKRTSRRLEVARKELREWADERWEALQRRLGEFQEETRLRAEAAQRRVSESRQSLNSGLSSAHSNIRRRLSETSEEVQRHASSAVARLRGLLGGWPARCGGALAVPLLGSAGTGRPRGAPQATAGDAEAAAGPAVPKAAPHPSRQHWARLPEAAAMRLESVFRLKGLASVDQNVLTAPEPAAHPVRVSVSGQPLQATHYNGLEASSAAKHGCFSAWAWPAGQGCCAGMPEGLLGRRPHHSSNDDRRCSVATRITVDSRPAATRLTAPAAGQVPDSALEDNRDARQ